MSYSPIKPHSGSNAHSQKIPLHYLKARYESPTRAKEEQCKSLEWLQKQMLSISVTAASPDAAQTCSQTVLDFPLLLSITCHQPFSSQTVVTQQGRDPFIAGQGLSVSYTHLMKGNRPSWTRCKF